MRLQSILLPNENICDVEEMYFHRKGEWLLFNGYFNLFYLEKHHKYCDIGELSLDLECKGFRKLVVMHDDMEICSKALEGERVSIRLPYASCDRGVLWFKMQLCTGMEDGQWDLKGGFNAQKDAGGVAGVEGAKGVGNAGGAEDVGAQVRLGINICTYKREPYVSRNMRTLIEWAEETRNQGPDAALFDGRSDVSKNMRVFIIDNGQTLGDNAEFRDLLSKASSVRKMIKVIPNANTGGTGGFSRGMQEAMDRRSELGLTHLLMMDDDAVFDPDLFVRLYGFLSMLRPEYKDITVGGALLREDYRYIQHAAGEWFTNYKVVNKHPLVDMREYANCVSDWMTGTEDEHSMYGAWWCCCYHMDAITRENMPLPLFVHHDDIQFGMKQSDRGIVFLNGVGVWHQGFELVFPGTKQYYNMRNTLITMSMFEPELLKKTYRRFAVRRYIGMLISLRYADCEFVYRGLRDFLKGREWLAGSDPEAIHKDLMEVYRDMCGMKPLEELGLSPEEMVDVRAQIGNLGGRAISPDELRGYYTPDRFKGPLSKKITFNGWILPPRSGIKVITPLDSPWNAYRYKRVLLYEPGTGKGALMKRSWKEFWKGAWRIIKICCPLFHCPPEAF